MFNAMAANWWHGTNNKNGHKSAFWVLIATVNKVKRLRERDRPANTLQWRHNERGSTPNHERLHCLLNCRFRCRSKKTSKLRVTGLCARNSPVTGEFSAQKADNAESVYIWWRHHETDRMHVRVRWELDRAMTWCFDIQRRPMGLILFAYE